MAFQIGTLNSPAFVKSILRDAKPVQASGADLIDKGVLLDEDQNYSYKYDSIESPLKSTQQLKIDWSKFENHTFFSSAEVKVNDAFNILINKFPFDGSNLNVQDYLNSLTGFEKYVFDQFPVWSGALHFSGTKVGENPANGFSSELGTWIEVKDSSGYNFPEISKNNTGNVVINPTASGSLSIETLIYLPNITNSSQVILQKKSNESNGFTFYLKPSSSSTHVTASFCVSSGSKSTSTSAVLTKGAYNHVCLVMNREDKNPNVYLQFYVNESLKSTSTKTINIGKLNIDANSLYIGSGSSFYENETLVSPAQTLSGTLDELRIFHNVRTLDKQKLFANRGIYSTPDLKLYYRFNEPPPLLSDNINDDVNSIVLDSSGNSLHSYINNFTGSLRVNASADSLHPISNEKKEFTIVLFPAYQKIKDLNTKLLVSASLYDDANPNAIVKLVPKHFLLEGAADDGFINEKGNAGQAYGGNGIPGQGQLGSTHLILTLLYIWAKFFDDIKLFVQTFGDLRRVNYSEDDAAPDNFLHDIIKSYGFYFPGLFHHSDINKFVEDTDGPETEYTTGIAFKKVHTKILRRLITNLDDIIRSKGTQHSIRSFLRSIGIDPDNSLKIREYGGKTTNILGTSRNKRQESIAAVDFVSSSLLISPPLSGTRQEPGFPKPLGSFVKNNLGKIIGTNNSSDGLLTSGSWTASCNYKFPEYKKINSNQSLMRLIVTGSETYAQPGLITNVVAIPKTVSADSKIIAYFRPGTSGSIDIASSSPILSMSLTISGKGIFDGDRWNVTFGRKRSDEIGEDYLSSSYYLRAGKSNYGEIVEAYTTSSFFNEKRSNEKNVFEFLSSSFNASGSFICIGSDQTIPTSAIQSFSFLNNTFEVDDSQARTTTFNGWASHLKFWSKSIDENEWREHVRNYKSVGVSNAKSNYNFTKNISGSFGRLRIDSFAKQIQKTSDENGKITIIDRSSNDLHFNGTNFGSGSSVVVVGDVESYSYLSPEFDEASSDDKVRIRGILNEENLSENSFATLGLAYSSNEAFLKEEPIDDNRLSIEFSLVDALDREIITMFSSLEELGDALGRPELMFSPDYPDLEVLRDVYFNNLTENVNFRKFLEFYRWFDNSISTFIEQLIPGKTKYKGTNFVIESHVLERHKRESRHSENYISKNQQFNKETALSTGFAVNIK